MKPKTAILASLVAVLVLTISGCTSGAPSPPPCCDTAWSNVDGFGIAVANNQNNPAPVLPESLDPLMEKVLPAQSVIPIFSATATPTLITYKPLNIPPNGTTSGNASRIDKNIDRINKALTSTPTGPGQNLFEAMLMAREALGDVRHPVIAVVGSGLDSAPSVMNTTQGLLLAPPDQIAQYVREHNPNVDLSSTTIVLCSLGYTSLPQEPLSAGRRQLVIAAWTAAIEALGGTVQVIAAPNTAAAVSTDQPVPTTGFDKSCVLQGNTVTYTFDSSLLPFGKGEYVLNEQAEAALAEAVTILQRYPGAQITIIGFTDTDGTPEYNYDLGMRRAEAVAAYLRIHLGQDLAITVDSMGESRLKVDETGKTGLELTIAQQANRRIELSISGTTTGCPS